MDWKFRRLILLITIISVFTYIGGIFAVKIIATSFDIDYTSDINVNHDNNNIVTPENYTKFGQLGVKDEFCCGHTDTSPPLITLESPVNDSICLGGTAIYLGFIDDNFMYNFSVYYHWKDDPSNTTIELGPVQGYLKLVLPHDDGRHVLYVYAVDYSENWASAKFSFTVVYCEAMGYQIGDPPTIDFVSPSASNEILTGNQIFRVNITDDIGLIQVTMQIDRGAELTKSYDATTGDYYRSFNVSELINGYHWLNITAIDEDCFQHTVRAKTDFTVIGGQETAIVSKPPEWDSTLSDLRANLSDYVNGGNISAYQAETGDLYFKVAVKDDRGISKLIKESY